MAIIEDRCTQCGTEVIVRTGTDARYRSRADGKQVIYKNELVDASGREYCIFRCEGCLEPVNETVPAAAYGEVV